MLGLQAMEALLLVASLESDIAAEALVTGSSLLPSLLQRLEQLHTALPADIDPSCLEEVEVSWAQVLELGTCKYFKRVYLLFPNSPVLVVHCMSGRSTARRRTVSLEGRRWWPCSPS